MKIMEKINKNIPFSVFANIRFRSNVCLFHIFDCALKIELKLCWFANELNWKYVNFGKNCAKSVTIIEHVAIVLIIGLLELGMFKIH